MLLDARAPPGTGAEEEDGVEQAAYVRVVCRALIGLKPAYKDDLCCPGAVDTTSETRVNASFRMLFVSWRGAPRCQAMPPACARSPNGFTRANSRSPAPQRSATFSTIFCSKPPGEARAQLHRPSAARAQTSARG